MFDCTGTNKLQSCTTDTECNNLNWKQEKATACLGGVVYNAYLQAKMDQVLLNGDTLPDDTELGNLNTLIQGLDDEGFMAESFGLQVYKSQQEAFSQMDFIDTSLQASYGNFPWIANVGVKGNASNKFVNTNLNTFNGAPIVGQDDAAFHIWITDFDTINTDKIIFCINSNLEIAMQNQAANFRARIHDEGAAHTYTTRAAGMYSFYRTTNFNVNVYKDAVLLGSYSQISRPLKNDPIYLFTRNALTNWSDAGASMFAITSKATEASLLNIYNLFNAYL